MTAKQMVLAIALSASIVQPAFAADRDDRRDERRSDNIVAGVISGAIGLIAAEAFDRDDRGRDDRGRDDRGPDRGGPRGHGRDDDRGPGRGGPDRGGPGDWNRGPDRGGPRGPGGPGHRPPPPSRRPVICYAQNRRRQIFEGRGYDGREAQRRAMDQCYAYSRNCAPAGCQR